MLWLVWAYAQAGLKLCWSHIPHCWKSHVTAQLCLKWWVRKYLHFYAEIFCLSKPVWHSVSLQQWCVCVCVRVCVRVSVYACVCEFVRACVKPCLLSLLFALWPTFHAPETLTLSVLLKKLADQVPHSIQEASWSGSTLFLHNMRIHISNKKSTYGIQNCTSSFYICPTRTSKLKFLTNPKWTETRSNKSGMVCLFIWFDSLRPINNLSVIKGRVFLCWTTTKLWLMCFAQAPFSLSRFKVPVHPGLMIRDEPWWTVSQPWRHRGQPWRSGMNRVEPC